MASGKQEWSDLELMDLSWFLYFGMLGADRMRFGWYFSVAIAGSVLVDEVEQHCTYT